EAARDLDERKRAYADDSSPHRRGRWQQRRVRRATTQVGRGQTAGRAHQHHRRGARGKPNLPPEMACHWLPPLGSNKTHPFGAISEQILVAKEETWTERSSDKAEFGKDRLH